MLQMIIKTSEYRTRSILRPNLFHLREFKASTLDFASLTLTPAPRSKYQAEKLVRRGGIQLN